MVALEGTKMRVTGGDSVSAPVTGHSTAIRQALLAFKSQAVTSLEVPLLSRARLDVLAPTFSSR